MPKFNVKRKYPYSAEQLYAVASDVGHYNKFIPLVRGSTIKDVEKHADGTTSFAAALTIVYKRLNISETVKSSIVVDPKARTIKAHASDGIIKNLDSVWKVYELPEGGSEVEMNVDYAMTSKMMQVLVSSVFDLALRRIATALGERVEKVHGKQAATA